MGGKDLAEAFIELKDVTLSFGAKSVLTGIDLGVEQGETMVVIGPSGSGKSTILRLLIGLLKPTLGEVCIQGKPVSKYDEEQWNRLRQTMGMVFQYSALFDFMTVGDNVAFGLRQHTDKSETEIKERVSHMLEMVGLAGQENVMPVNLSGGMKKRVSLARAIAVQPKIVLYDEPTAGLDPIMADVINELIVRTRDLLGVTSVVVTHDMDSAFRVADKIAMLDGGKIIFAGTPEAIRTTTDERVRRFVYAGRGKLAVHMAEEEQHEFQQ